MQRLLLRLGVPALILMASSALAPVARAANQVGSGTDDRAAGGYLVVTIGLDALADSEAADVYRATARRAALFHGGQYQPLDGVPSDVADRTDPPLPGARATMEALALLELTCAAASARHEDVTDLLVVVPPERLDAGLHRRLLAFSHGLDEDPFCDLRLGYLTASDPARLVAFWEANETAQRDGLRSKRWMGAFVTSQMASTIYANHLPEIASAAGYSGSSLAFSCVESDPHVLEFVDEHLTDLEGAGVLSLTGNGDPQGIWLFDGQRNMDRSLHWPYAPERVGEDPLGRMPRLRASQLRALDLAGTVVWSGTCHSAVPLAAWVEGDIVSTFGRVDAPTRHLLTKNDSLCLAFIDAGAVALVAPIGANHGMAVDREQEHALRHGAALGDAVRSTYVDLVLARGARPVLGVPGGTPAEMEAWEHEPVMPGGGANRILIGDPGLRPFATTPHPDERVRIETTPGTRSETSVFHTVHVEWDPGFHADAWDMYGADRAADWRVRTRLEFDPLELPLDAHVEIVGFAATRPRDGASLPYRATRAMVEHHAGRAYLHLVANAPRAGLEYEGVHARFVVVVTRP
jgi:hypothetical protein